MAKKAKQSDAVMTGILVTKFNMGLINIDDLRNMATDAGRAERCWRLWKNDNGLLLFILHVVDKLIIRM